MARTKPPRRRRKKTKQQAVPSKSRGGAGAPPKQPKIKRTRSRMTRIRFGGVFLLGVILCSLVALTMYSWAAMRVQEFLDHRALGSGSVLSSSTVLASVARPVSAEQTGDAGALGATHPLSKSTWQKVLAAHGYTESETQAPKTFEFLEPSSELRITAANKRSVIVTKAGEFFSIGENGSRQAAAQIELEPIPLGNYQSDGERVGLSVPLAAFSPAVVAAIVSVEDERFFRHFGIDLNGIARAFVVNVSAGGWVQGGSTLTQQLAKNIFLSFNRSLTRKFKEVFLSIALERALTKQQLLEIYLNEVYLGSQAGNPIRGVPAAARWLFNKSPGELTVSESALIAGMIQAPAINNPRTREENAEARRKVALQRMLDAGRISLSDLREALADRPRIYKPPSDTAPVAPPTGLAPYVAAAIGKSPTSDTARIQTTISPPLQRCAEQAVSNGAQQIARRLKRREKSVAPQIGFVAIDVDANATVALVGGTNFAVNKINHVTELPRQFGSIVKPFVYLRAFEDGLTLDSTIQDEPLTVGKWSPDNFDHQFRGAVTARYALENSLNIPAIRVAQRVGFDVVATTFAQFGITKSGTRSAKEIYPALAIGAVEGTLFDITNGYAALARGGRFLRAHTVSTYSDSTPSRGDKIADERAVFLVTNALQGVVQRGTARGLDAAGFPSIAGKTGTSDSTRDAWFVGFTPSHAIGVWVGYDNNQPLGLTGGVAAAPIAGAFLRCSSELIPKRRFVIPAGVVLRSVENNSGDSNVQEFYIAAEAATASTDAYSETDAAAAKIHRSVRRSGSNWLERFLGLQF